VPSKKEASVRWLPRDDTTFHTDEMPSKERWQYYISSFVRVAPTEGVDRSRMQKVVLARNIPSADADIEDSNIPKAMCFQEDLAVRICINTSLMSWEKGTSEHFVYDKAPKSKQEKDQREEYRKALTRHRESKLMSKLVHNNSWMKDMTQDEVQKLNEQWQKWKEDAVIPPKEEDRMDTTE
jgi:paired amphipathic helix protein Sin3a